MEKPSKNRRIDRRKVLHPVTRERRAGRERRKNCPVCNSPLLSNVHKTSLYHQWTFVCTNGGCTYTELSRQVPVGKVRAEQAYELGLRTTMNSLWLELPLEFCASVGLTGASKLKLTVQSPTRWILEKTTK